MKCPLCQRTVNESARNCSTCGAAVELARQRRDNRWWKFHGTVSMTSFFLLGVPSLLIGSLSLVFEIADVRQRGWESWDFMSCSFIAVFLVGFFVLLRAVRRDGGF